MIIDYPVYIMECDNGDCGETTIEYGDPTDLRCEAMSDGWVIDEDDKHLCPKCAQDGQEEGSDED